jgi:hypothetical protein
MARTVRVMDFDKAMSDILKEYGDSVEEKSHKAAAKVAKIAKQEVQAGAPHRSGRYRKGWSVTEEKTSRLWFEYTVHNRSRYQLAHLLEKGHALKRGGRTYGHVPARPHIAPAEQKAVRNYEEALERIAKEG